MMHHREQPKRAISDGELRELLANDPHRHFELLAEEYAERLYIYVYRMTRDEEDAKDVVQTALLRAYTALTGRPAASILKMNLQPWLYAIAYHVFVDHYRNRKRLPSTPIDTSEDSPLLYLEADPGMQPDIAAERVEQGEKIMEAIQNLPLAYREIAFLYFIENWSRTEIAERQNKPLNTVKSAIQRSGLLLRQALKTPKVSKMTKKKEQ